MDTPPTPNISADALAKIKALFEADRWAKIEAQAKRQACDLQELCTRLLFTSLVRHPSNDAAATASAANRLLISLGSVLKPEDEQRYESALKPAEEAPAAETPGRAKRGGKADAAPPPAN